MEDPREVLRRPAPPPDLTVAYGPLPEHVIDVRLPERTPGPLVVVIHGGFWRAAYDRGHTGPMASALADAGYVVAIPEYRRTGDGGGWPETFDDIATALEAVPELLSSRGSGLPVWVGHSAGGHLALWAAARPKPPARRVVSLAGVADLALGSSLGLDKGAVDILMGGPPERVPDRYAVADPVWLPPPTVPVTLLHGTADDVVPIELSRSYARRIGGDLRELPDVDHFALIDPRSAAWPEVLRAIGS